MIKRLQAGNISPLLGITDLTDYETPGTYSNSVLFSHFAPTAARLVWQDVQKRNPLQEKAGRYSCPHPGQIRR